jgi:flagellar basal-body rod protein FlgF
MDHLIYTSLTAMRGSMSRQTATANNLANAETPGFRADVSEAEALWQTGDGLNTRVMASQEVVAANMTAGTVTSTGRDLDIALNADSMLALQSTDGEEVYTRRGDLQISETGLLTNGDSRPVLGAQGPITLPPYDKVQIDAEGRISIIPRGGDPAQPQEVERLKLVAPSNQPLAKGLDGLFRVKGGGTLPDDPDARLIVGHLEGSNVSATESLVNMIDASRSWDYQLKLLSNARDMDSATADLMRMPE